MPTTELIHSVIHIAATLYAVIVASVALRLAIHHNNRALKRQLDELRLDIDKQAHWYTKLNANVASVRASLSNNKKPRENDEDEELSFEQSANETPEQWKKRMRVQMAGGKLKHR